MAPIITATDIKTMCIALMDAMKSADEAQWTYPFGRELTQLKDERARYDSTTIKAVNILTRMTARYKALGKKKYQQQRPARM